MGPYNCTAMAKKLTQINFHKVCGLSFTMTNCILQNVLKSISGIAINCKVPLCHENELNPQKTFPLHFSPADIMSVILSLPQVRVMTRTRPCVMLIELE